MSLSMYGCVRVCAMVAMAGCLTTGLQSVEMCVVYVFVHNSSMGFLLLSGKSHRPTSVECNEFSSSFAR